MENLTNSTINTTADANPVKIKTIVSIESVETEIQISTEILIMLFLLMISITLGHLLKKSKHKYL